uniref:Ion transport domain-containing protein n=1 Tax=Timema genevievae TaxID=629358 RepID=A0A7R9PGJ1_TIMGE|nr:unnamed protein product [Timema genevievae]
MSQHKMTANVNRKSFNTRSSTNMYRRQARQSIVHPTLGHAGNIVELSISDGVLSPTQELANALVMLSSTAEDGEIEVRISVGCRICEANTSIFENVGKCLSRGDESVVEEVAKGPGNYNQQEDDIVHFCMYQETKAQWRKWLRDQGTITSKKMTFFIFESKLQWRSVEEAISDQGTITSEEEVASGSDSEVRMRGQPSAAIWARDHMTECLRALPGGDELWTMLEARNIEAVAKHSYGATTGLLLAAWRGDHIALSDILNTRASISIVDVEGRTPLHLAACSGSAACVDLLLRRGANAQSWDTQRVATPLMCAASVGNLPCVKLLLQAGAEVNAGLTRCSALHYAVQSGATECARELLKEGASPNTPQVYTETPLHVAAALGSAVCIRMLLDHGADVRVQFGVSKSTALHLAAEDEKAECARLLLDAGAEVGATNYRLQTPLHLAALAQAGETLELLLGHGADPNAEDADGRTPLHSAIVKSCRSCECVRHLLDAGADVNKADAFGYTPLHIAALNEFASCVWLLLNHGGDLTARTNGGVSALAFIVRRTPSVLPRVLAKFDHAVKLHDHEIGDVDCELKLDFTLLVPSVERGESGLLLAFIEVGQRHILKHPLCETFLFLKWRRIRKFFLFSLVFHSVFVLLFSLYVWRVFLQDCSNTSRPLCDLPGYVDAAGYVLVVLNLIFLAKEVFQIAHSWTRYICHWENWLQWLIIISVFPCVLHVRSTGDASKDLATWQHHVAAIAIFLTWVELMMLVGRFPMFGLYIQMFTTVSINFAKFLLAYSCLFVAFAMGFGVLFPNYPSFENLAWCLMKTLVMMSGELEFEDIFYADYPIMYPVTAHLLFITFVILVTVILTNLLVGLAVSDIQGLQQSAGLDRLVRQAQLVAHLESMLFSRLLRCLPAKLLSVCHRSALLVTSAYQSSLYIRPNDPRENRIPKELINSAYQLVAERKDKSRGKQSHKDTYVYSSVKSYTDGGGDYNYIKLTHPNPSGGNTYGMTTCTQPSRGSSSSRLRETEVVLGQILSQLGSMSVESEQRDTAAQQALKQLIEQVNRIQIQLMDNINKAST